MIDINTFGGRVLPARRQFGGTFDNSKTCLPAADVSPLKIYRRQTVGIKK